MRYIFPLLALVLTAGAAFSAGEAIAQSAAAQSEAKPLCSLATVSCPVATATVKVSVTKAPVVKLGGTYVVQEGDVLSLIAERVLKGASRWTELYELNRDLIKDPACLKLGSKLRLPSGVYYTPPKVVKRDTPRPRVRMASRGLLGDIGRLIRGNICRPLLGAISSGFGSRDGRMHAGVDIPRDTGTPIHAVDDGVVIRADWFANYGKTIDIQHRPGFVTRYAHCSSMHVGVGSRIRKGEIIGSVGSTGRATCPHLHFEVRLHDRPVNPERFI